MLLATHHLERRSRTPFEIGGENKIRSTSLTYNSSSIWFVLAIVAEECSQTLRQGAPVHGVVGVRHRRSTRHWFADLCTYRTLHWPHRSMQHFDADVADAVHTRWAMVGGIGGTDDRILLQAQHVVAE
jgi:hypothetical protein